MLEVQIENGSNVDQCGIVVVTAWGLSSIMPMSMVWLTGQVGGCIDKWNGESGSSEKCHGEKTSCLIHGEWFGLEFLA